MTTETPGSEDTEPTAKAPTSETPIAEDEETLEQASGGYVHHRAPDDCGGDFPFGWL